jgi:hypothetical protein
MTSVRALPPVLYVLPNSVSVPRGNHNPHGITSSQNFQALLKAQIKPSLASRDPANSLTQAEQANDLPHGPNIEAMLQQLYACRKMRLHGALDAGDAVECAPQLPTTVPTLPANIVIWIPVDIRTPRHFSGARRRRRRRPRSPDGYRSRGYPSELQWDDT